MSPVPRARRDVRSGVECQRPARASLGGSCVFRPHKVASGRAAMDEDSVKIEIPEPSYTLFNAQRDGLPQVVVVNEALLSFQWTRLFSWHLRVCIEAEDLAEHGMPTSRESSLLFEVGDQIEKLVLEGRTAQGAENALFLARSTWNGFRDLYFQ